MKHILLTSLLTIPFVTNAQDTASSTPANWEFGLSIGAATIDQEAANAAYIEDQALAIDVYVDYVKSQWISTFGLSFISYNDQNEFSVLTRNSFSGDISEEESSATGTLLYGAFGRLWTHPSNTKVNYYAQGGLSLMASSERSIDFCDNCPEQDIEIDGGVFAKAGVNYNFNSFAMGAHFTQYLSGDLNNNLMLSISTKY